MQKIFHKDFEEFLSALISFQRTVSKYEKVYFIFKKYIGLEKIVRFLVSYPNQTY